MTHCGIVARLSGSARGHHPLVTTEAGTLLGCCYYFFIVPAVNDRQDAARYISAKFRGGVSFNNVAHAMVLMAKRAV
jgi:hypothetical protein